MNTPEAEPYGERAVFVDENTCIGCRNCEHCAERTFFIEEEFGRARVYQQWADNAKDIDIAIESCPVDCIHYVSAADLPVLEYVMKTARRTNVAVSMMGFAGEDPFDLANTFRRKSREYTNRAGSLGDGTSIRAAPAMVSAAILVAWKKLSGKTRTAWTNLGRYAR
eukprot:scaffold7446_cov403-Prasinococcus_capsulatus_cf.AAC.12